MTHNQHFYVSAQVWLAASVVINALSGDVFWPSLMCMGLALFFVFAWFMTRDEA